MSVTLVLLGLVALALLTALVVFVAMRPVWAAYIFLATQPFVGGIDRGQLIPLFRPSEAIQLILTTAVLLGVLVRVIRGEQLSVRFTRLDRAVALLAIVSSVWPLCWQFARGQIPSIASIVTVGSRSSAADAAQPLQSAYAAAKTGSAHPPGPPS